MSGQGPRLDLVVGCNGAGKSTLVEYVLSRRLGRSIFVNADLIAKECWPDDVEAKSYEAARIAEDTRRQLVEHGQSFIAETVFSHPSKLQLIDDAHARGFQVDLHVVMIPEDVAVDRVTARVAAGGHPVPETKIRERYQRLWPLVADAVGRADAAMIFDNSGTRMAPIARFRNGFIVSLDHGWPEWTPAAIRDLGRPTSAR